ncbi:hypothetical protein FAM09_11600 [Niastella caeni]|uniref:HEAT repeat domain-containing protein n=1 Tax=Niastella caeni TaxID=2569763 RepID=A0A4V4H151_9BACT|nr:hypothetical protein [Niastella caeni]THU39156.1 hypothetical protein FAM09_11600 [Niastella caeni]
MNQFVNQFGDAIKSYWETASEGLKQQLIKDILQYANTNPQTFKRDLEKVQFDNKLTPLAVVLEALSKETDTWGQFYVDTLDAIFEQAKIANKPQDILSCLMEFAYIEKDHRPFVQSIVDRLHKETDSDNLASKLAAIWTLPAYLANPSVRNKSLIVDSLQQKLYDKNWKVRYVAYKSLSFENMLPIGHKLSIGDQIRKVVFGEPPMI